LLLLDLLCGLLFCVGIVVDGVVRVVPGCSGTLLERILILIVVGIVDCAVLSCLLLIGCGYC